MSNVDDRYHNHYAEWETLSYQGMREIPSAIAANFFTGYTNNPSSVLSTFAGVMYVQDDRHSLYFPNLQNTVIPPSPPVGSPLVELVSPPEGEIGPKELVKLKVSNIEDITNKTIILYVVFFEPGDEDDEAEIALRQTLVVHDGNSFKYVFNNQESGVISYTEDDRDYLEYTIRNEASWPVGLKTRFIVQVADASGETI